jgi:hypothetical protein
LPRIPERTAQAAPLDPELDVDVPALELLVLVEPPVELEGPPLLAVLDSPPLPAEPTLPDPPEPQAAHQVARAAPSNARGTRAQR